MEKFNIKIMSEDEMFDPSFGGTFTKPDARHFYLTHPQAATMFVMMGLPTAEEQFDFFCYAYLRRLYGDMGARFMHNPNATEIYYHLSDKFGFPWSGQVRHPLPNLDGFPDPRVLTDNGIDEALLAEKYQGYVKCEYFLNPDWGLQAKYEKRANQAP